MPPETFNKVWKLFDQVLLEPGLSYVVTVDFPGWLRKRLGDESDFIEGIYKDSWLTMDEFLNGENYYSNKVDFGISYRKNKTEEIEKLDEQEPPPLKENPVTQ